MCSDKFQLVAGAGCVHTCATCFFYFFVTFRDCQRSFSDPAAFEVDVKSLLAKSFYCSHLIVVAFELHFDICII